MSLDDFFNLDLDDLISVSPVSEPELVAGQELGSSELAAARAVVECALEQSACQISNIQEVTEAADLLINSSISEDHKAALAKLRDQLPFLASTIKSAQQTEEENEKKLEARKSSAEVLAKLKAKFELAKAKGQEVEKRASAVQTEIDRLRSLLEAEEAKLAKLEESKKTIDKAISFTGEQAISEAKQLATSKADAANWAKLVSRAKKDRSTSEQKWEALKSQLADF